MARDGRFGLLQRDDELTQQFEAERRMTREMAETCERLEEENATLKGQLQSRQSIDKSLRDQIDAEWSAKLQSVVSHIVGDHEAEIGKAIEEREAARAEARNLVGKVSTLQQRIDAERQAVAAAEEKLRRSQDEIIALRATPAAPEPPVLQPPPPLPEISEDRARADVLEFAEQANEVLRRVSSPGNVPLPAVERKTRVLFVHHDPASRSMWRDNLEKNGFDVVIAADGLEGLRLAMAHKPDVVVADASMPKMDGRELCQLIKSNPETANVKVILMTGVYTNEAPIDAREFEADELLRKPVKFEALKAALAGLLAVTPSS
jgi:CheY-like chemotaxis protein